MSCTPFPSPASLLHLCHVDTSAWSAEDAHGDHGRPSAVSISSESEDDDAFKFIDKGGYSFMLPPKERLAAYQALTYSRLPGADERQART